MNDFICRHTTNNARHKKSVKIGVALFTLTVVCYLSVVLLALSNLVISPYLFYLLYFNNLGNFFIYFWIDEKFRKFILLKK